MQQRIQKNEIYEGMVLLDSQSTHSTFCEGGYLSNIRDSNRVLKMKTNGGIILYRQVGELQGYGTVWYNDKSIANIISMSEAENKGYVISYSLGCFRLKNPHTTKTMKFMKTAEGLYGCRVVHGVPHAGISLIQTVDKNKSWFTPRQVNRAKNA